MYVYIHIHILSHLRIYIYSSRISTSIAKDRSVESRNGCGNIADLAANALQAQIKYVERCELCMCRWRCVYRYCVCVCVCVDSKRCGYKYGVATISRSSMLKGAILCICMCRWQDEMMECIQVDVRTYVCIQAYMCMYVYRSSMLKGAISICRWQDELWI